MYTSKEKTKHVNNEYTISHTIFFDVSFLSIECCSTTFSIHSKFQISYNGKIIRRILFFLVTHIYYMTKELYYTFAMKIIITDVQG